LDLSFDRLLMMMMMVCSLRVYRTYSDTGKRSSGGDGYTSYFRQ